LSASAMATPIQCCAIAISWPRTNSSFVASARRKQSRAISSNSFDIFRDLFQLATTHKHYINGLSGSSVPQRLSLRSFKLGLGEGPPSDLHSLRRGDGSTARQGARLSIGRGRRGRAQGLASRRTRGVGVPGGDRRVLSAAAWGRRRSVLRVVTRVDRIVGVVRVVRIVGLASPEVEGGRNRRAGICRMRASG
jgi:hypothetical protein